jgi:hypothetical protein
MQVNESLKLRDERETELTRLRSQLRSANVRLNSAVTASELGRRSAASEYENLLSDISRQIGFLESEIAQLQRREALARRIDDLTARKAALAARMSVTQDKISAGLEAQRDRKGIAYTEVSDKAKDLLSRDLHEHSDFADVETVTFDFANDWIAINGEKNRVGSASGMVILKNSFLLGLFWGALTDRQFNLPRFMLMDNIEDKGMLQERSWNFQRLIIDMCNKSSVDKQVIFSTSKIAPELAETALVIGGRKYTRERRTLIVS